MGFSNYKLTENTLKKHWLSIIGSKKTAKETNERYPTTRSHSARQEN